MNWLTYLLEANINLAIFYALYKLILSRETFYSLNRFYLLTTSIAAFILPFFKLGSLQFSSSDIVSVANIQYSKIPVNIQPIPQAPSFWTVDTVLFTVYSAVVLFMLMRFCYSLYKLNSLIKKFKVQKQGGLKIVNLTDQQASFSFLNYVFVNLMSEHADTIIKHEKAHSKEYHTVDVLIFELIHIFNWFNPVILYVKKDVKALHEFSADAATLDEDLNAKDYSMFLIQYSYASAGQNLVSQMFNSRLLKNRITMLYNTPSSDIAKLKYLVLIPLMLLLVCFSSITYTKSYGIDLLPKKQDDVTIQDETPDIVYVRRDDAKIFPKSTRKTVIAKTIKGSKTFKSETISQTEQYPVLNIDGRTDTVKIRPSATTYAQMYKGIYVIGDKIYEEKQLRKALEQSTNKLDIVLKAQPEVGYYTPDDANAIKIWGERAKNGVIFALSRPNATDTINH